MDLSQVEEAIGYRFRDPSLLEQALTHRSGALVQGRHNERLEFFGDALVGMAVCEHVYDLLPGADEGRLTKIKAKAVARETFARVLRGAFWRKAIRVGGGLERRAELPDSVYANVFEAVVAAVYYDSGRDYGMARDLALRLLAQELAAAVEAPGDDNPKALLQHWAQIRGCEVAYPVVGRRGADHCPVFTVAAVAAGRELARGAGNSKKEAEQAAASAALAVVGQVAL